ncbi:MAG: hypothetical protein OWV35_10795, partial [Firmicutes bacterium]|nr:hypothetical protein [Bacillota bacterium]
MDKRRVRAAALLVMAGLAGGCGGPARPAAVRPAGGTRTAATVPGGWRVWTPAGVTGFTTGPVAVALRGRGLDTLSVHPVSRFSSRLEVTDAGGRVIWTLDHVGAVAVYRFAGHLPVLLLRADADFCGSGGCVYRSYTWNPARGAFVPVPAPAAAAVAYRYDPATAAFTAVPQPLEGLTPADWSGFVTAGTRGPGVTVRLYDTLQHVQTQDWRYESRASDPTGRWVPAGPPRFGPDSPVGSGALVALGDTPGAAAEAFVT